MVLAHRPPISIPRTSVAPGLLEELLGEISSLASVYHKPEETFIGRGRIGADAVQRKAELVIYKFDRIPVSQPASRPIGWETTASRPNGQSRLSLLDSRQRTCCWCHSFLLSLKSNSRFLQRLRRRTSRGRSALGTGSNRSAVTASSSESAGRDIQQPTG